MQIGFGPPYSSTSHTPSHTPPITSHTPSHTPPITSHTPSHTPPITFTHVYACTYIPLTTQYSKPNVYSPSTEGQQFFNETLPSSPSSQTNTPLLPINDRTFSQLNKALENYEVGFGDYASPIFSPASKEDELRQQLTSLGIEEIPEDELE